MTTACIIRHSRRTVSIASGYMEERENSQTANVKLRMYNIVDILRYRVTLLTPVFAVTRQERRSIAACR